MRKINDSMRLNFCESAPHIIRNANETEHVEVFHFENRQFNEINLDIGVRVNDMTK